MNKKQTLVTIKQLPFWNSLLEENLAFLESGFDYPVFGVPTVKELLQKIYYFYSRKTIWLIQYEATVVGIYAIGNFPEPINGKDNWYETVIYVHPDYRNLGIAKMLTLSTAKSFEKKNRLNLLVEVRTDNFRSINAHKKIFPDVPLVLVEHEDFNAYQWRLTEDYSVTKDFNKWLAEEISIGMTPALKNTHN